MSNTLLAIVIVVGLAFDFTNGFHDTANYVATWVGTRSLSPRWAVAISAAANLAGAFVTTAVATTVGKGIIETGLATEKTVLAALLGAIAWNLLTWRLGLPSSSTHALVGGLVGAALVQSGSRGVQWHGIWQKIVLPGAVSPLVGFAGAFLLVVLIYRLCFRLSPGVAHRGFRYGQLVSGTWVAFTHGANDAQKTMGVIALALAANGNIHGFYIPTWVKIAAGLTIAAGTYAGGWRIIRTLGQRVYAMQPEHGFAAQAAAGTTLWIGTRYGFPISTTHVVTGSVMGAGSARRFSAVKWGVAGNIMLAWVLTLPAAALVAAAFFYPVNWIF
ncbi:MAG: inorganic phosphate transporter [Gaiellaceae bacterium]